jgi:hypothetical protein
MHHPAVLIQLQPAGLGELLQGSKRINQLLAVGAAPSGAGIPTDCACIPFDASATVIAAGHVPQRSGRTELLIEERVASAREPASGFPCPPVERRAASTIS